MQNAIQAYHWNADQSPGVQIINWLFLFVHDKIKTRKGGLCNYGSCFVFRPATRCLFQWCRGTMMIWNRLLGISGAAIASKDLRHMMN